MKFIRDIIGEKRHHPRKEADAGQGRIPTGPAADLAQPVASALRLQPEHRIPEAGAQQILPEPVAQDWRAAPEADPWEADSWEAAPTKDRLWDEGSDEDEYTPTEIAGEDGFAPAVQELSEILGREEEAQAVEAEGMALAEGPKDVPEDPGVNLVEDLAENSGQDETGVMPHADAAEDEGSDADTPLADLSEDDLSAWLARMDRAPAQVGDEMAATLAEDAAPEPQAKAEDAAEPDFALSLRAVKDVMGQSAQPVPQAEAAPEPEALAPEPLAEPAAAAPDSAELPAGPVDVPTPALGRGSSRPGRVKTRLLGFNPGQVAGLDPLARSREDAQGSGASFPVGWLVVVKGPGRGTAFTLQGGVAQIGRGAGQAVRLDFGDNSISRENHAAVAYDDESQTFYIGHGGKANLVRRNGRPVLSTEEMSPGDLIVIGETTLKFVPLCGPQFSWADETQGGQAHASLG
jgi:hypothetical protein